MEQREIRADACGMKSESLRIEYVIVGSAFILTMLAGWEEAVRLFPHGKNLSIFTILHPQMSSGAWAAATAAALGASYTFGAFLVQLTYTAVARRHVKNARTKRLKELHNLDLLMRAVSTPANDSLLDQIFGGTYAQAESTLDLALTIGRTNMTSAAHDEYIYRRSNRQIFSGLRPSVYLAFFDIGLIPGPHLRMDLTHKLLVAAACVAVAEMILIRFRARLLDEPVSYQEQVAQSLILDSAFLTRWKQ
jgi:hypothetical protein